jgi:hypothetical protein
MEWVAYSILVEKPEENLSFENLGVDGNFILKWILKNRVELLNHIGVFQDRDKYVEINQPNTLKLYISLFFLTMTHTCFGKTMLSSGSVYFPVWATSLPEDGIVLPLWEKKIKRYIISVHLIGESLRSR